MRSVRMLVCFIYSQSCTCNSFCLAVFFMEIRPNWKLEGKKKRQRGMRKRERGKERKRKLFMFISSTLLQNCFLGLDEVSGTSSGAA